MFERFTEKAIKVIMLAQQESRRLSHNFVGTEQILLGLIAEEGGVAGRALRAAGVNLQTARREVESIIGRGSDAVGFEIPFTPRAKRAIEFAWQEALELDHNYIGTEHLLLGLLRENAGVGNRVLANMHISTDELRNSVMRAIPDARIGPLPEEPMVPAEIGDLREGAFKWYRLDAVNAMKRARAGAELLGHASALPGHLVLALLQEESSFAGAGVDLPKLRNLILRSFETEEMNIGVRPMPISPALQDALRQAWLEAVALKVDFVSKDAIILGLLHEGGGTTRGAVESCGGKVDEIVNGLRESIKKAQEERATQPPPAASADAEQPRSTVGTAGLSQHQIIYGTLAVTLLLVLLLALRH